MSEPLQAATRRTVGVRDIPLVLLAPRRLFARVEDVAAWGWPLLVLLTVVTLIGYARIETGLIDREVDREVRESIERIDAEQRDVVERSELRELYEQQHKMGEFKKLLARMQAVVTEPVKALAAALLIAAVLYGVVALSGRKPEWHTLLTICVYAGFIDLLRLLMTLVLMLRYGTLAVDTSAALLVRFMAEGEGTNATTLAVMSGLLTGLDPFRVWYWLVVITGLAGTAQLPGWRAWVTCGVCWLVAAGGHCALAVARMPGAMGAPAG